MKARALRVKVTLAGAWATERRIDRLRRKAERLADALERAAGAIEKLNDER